MVARWLLGVKNDQFCIPEALTDCELVTFVSWRNRCHRLNKFLMFTTLRGRFFGFNSSIFREPSLILMHHSVITLVYSRVMLQTAYFACCCETITKKKKNLFLGPSFTDCLLCIKGSEGFVKSALEAQKKIPLPQQVPVWAIRVRVQTWKKKKKNFVSVAFQGSSLTLTHQTEQI